MPNKRVDIADPGGGGGGGLPPPANSRITDGLVALWEFDGLSGDAVPDISGAGTPLDLALTSVGGSSWTAYALNMAGPARLQTSGAATKISAAAAASNAITIEMWLKPAMALQSGPARIWSLAQDGSARNLTLGHGTELGGASASLNVRCLNATTFNSADGTFAEALTHVVYMRGSSDNTSRVFVNGTLVTTAANASAFNSWNLGYPLAIGNEVGSTIRPWAGEIHLVAVYGKALSTPEVQHNFSIGVPALWGPPAPAAPNLHSVAGGTNGDDNGIALAWGAVSEASIYRIFRGTEQNATAQIDSTAAATSYFDSTAAEGVTYYYRLKAVSGAGVASAYSNERNTYWSSSASPAVTDIIGTVAHGAEIVISGSGFGIGASPVVFDDFDDGSADGDIIDLTATHGSWTLTEATAPLYSTTRAHVGASFRSRHGGSSGTTSDLQVNSSRFNNGLYLDAWIYFDYESSAPWSRKNQPFYIRSSTAPAPEIHFDYQYDDYTYPCDVTDWKITTYGGDNPQFTYATKDEIRGQWRHMQMWFAPDSDGQSDGQAYGWLDGQLRFGSDSVDWRGDGDGLWNRIMIGYYYALDALGGCPPPVGSWDNYWDSVYISDTRARIEIGNSDTWAGCTVREIQIPSAWSPTSITCTINAGSLVGTNYLYVIDANGTVSNDFRIEVAAPTP